MFRTGNHRIIGIWDRNDLKCQKAAEMIFKTIGPLSHHAAGIIPVTLRQTGITTTAKEEINAAEITIITRVREEQEPMAELGEVGLGEGDSLKGWTWLVIKLLKRLFSFNFTQTFALLRRVFASLRHIVSLMPAEESGRSG